MTKGLGGKYLVFDASGKSLDADEVFVLKRGDTLAVAALRSYVNNALLVLDVEQMARADGARPFLTDEERRNLTDLADAVGGLADHWEDHTQGKLPD